MKPAYLARCYAPKYNKQPKPIRSKYFDPDSVHRSIQSLQAADCATPHYISARRHFDSHCHAKESRSPCKRHGPRAAKSNFSCEIVRIRNGVARKYK